MFNMGFSEILLLSAIALIVIGPKQLPQIARTLGRFFNELKRATGEVSQAFHETQKKSDDIFSTKPESQDLEKEGPTQIKQESIPSKNSNSENKNT